jgi:hypothetical protein
MACLSRSKLTKSSFLATKLAGGEQQANIYVTCTAHMHMLESLSFTSLSSSTQDAAAPKKTS